MALNNPKPNQNDANGYLVSGIPYVSSSIASPGTASDPVVISFPYVTQRFFVDCTGGTGVRVGYSRNGVKGVENENYFVVLAAAAPQEFRVRVGEVYLLSSDGSASTCAISAEMCPAPGGQIADGVLNNWSGSLGVG